VSLVAAPAITGDGSTVWRIIVSWNGMQSTVIGDTWEVRIKDSTTQLAAQRLLNTKVSATEAGGTLMTTDVPTAASHTYTAYAVRVGGTGTGIWAAAATFPLTIAVDPIG
jgi:hypothetical protein